MLFMECLHKVGDVSVVSEEQYKLLFETFLGTIPINEAGHVDWTKIKCEKIRVAYNQLKDYADSFMNCYIIWNDYDLPPIKCKIQSVINNSDEFESVAFSYIALSEDFKLVFESEKFGFVNLGVMNN